MNTDIEMHDSECLSIERNPNGSGTVILNAYVHRYEGLFGKAPHEGGMQRIRMTIDSMTVSGDIGELPARIYDGSLKVGQEILDNIIRFPATHKEAITLIMTLSEDARQVEISGRGIRVFAENAFRFIEHVDFTDSASPAPPRS